MDDKESNIVDVDVFRKKKIQNAQEKPVVLSIDHYVPGSEALIARANSLLNLFDITDPPAIELYTALATLEQNFQAYARSPKIVGQINLTGAFHETKQAYESAKNQYYESFLPLDHADTIAQKVECISQEDPVSAKAISLRNRANILHNDVPRAQRVNFLIARNQMNSASEKYSRAIGVDVKYEAQCALELRVNKFDSVLSKVETYLANKKGETHDAN